MRLTIAWAVSASLAATLISMPTAGAASAPAPRPNGLKAVSALPPGESGFFSTSGQAAYEANGNPSDFGPHVDDQRAPYWHFRYLPDGFAKVSGTPLQPHAGVQIWRDGQGVPVIHGKTGWDVWFGAGYAAATDRLFEMDAIRRLAEGRLAELTGAGQVPADLQQRILTYTPAEYRRMFQRLPARGRAAIAGYAAGVEARIKQVNAGPARAGRGRAAVHRHRRPGPPAAGRRLVDRRHDGGRGLHHPQRRQPGRRGDGQRRLPAPAG